MCSSRTSAPGSSTGSGSPPPGAWRSTPAWSSSRSPDSATTVPKPHAPATTRSPRARPDGRRRTAPSPRLVSPSITGFGHDGPEASRAGYDQIAQGEAGLMSLTGSGPDDMQRVGVPIADLLAGIYGSYGVLAALLERERTGRGKV